MAKSIFQILNPKSNLTIKLISLSAFQILSNYLHTTKFDLQTTNLTKFFYRNLRVLGLLGIGCDIHEDAEVEKELPSPTEAVR